jgi:HAD superfamily hydrolase (TIGR01450 family)
VDTNTDKLSKPIEMTVTSLIEKYECVLLDVYGVLLDKSGPLPGAQQLIDYLNLKGKPYLVLSNSASSLTTNMARDLQNMGLSISKDRLITSGMLLVDYFRSHGLRGRRCLVLGTEDSKQYVTAAGGVIVAANTMQRVDIVVIADQAGFPLLEVLDDTLSVILRQLDKRESMHLVLCNPDLIYPRGHGRLGFTAGGLAVMVESVLRERYPGEAHGFERLGKPYPPLFEEALRRAGTKSLVMIGDQISTDIQGAKQSGIDAALVATGIARVDDVWLAGTTVPDYILKSLHP